MGRFLNSRAVAPADSSPLLKPLERRQPFSTVVTAPEPVMRPVSLDEANPVLSMPAVVGLYALCAYLISGYATDLSYRFLGTKPYVSMVSGVLVFVCFAISGNALAALRTNAGRLWVALGLWMCVDVIFSQWRGGSLELMEVYLPKQHMLLFYIAALAVTIKQCRAVLRASILGSFVLILTCFFFGSPEPSSGRFIIPTNVYLNNPNDLAMQLLMALGFFLFWMKQPGFLGRVGGSVGLIGAVFFILKTGSRGGLLASAVLAVLWVMFSKNRLIILGLTIPALLVLAVITPGETIRRLSLTVLNPEEEAAVATTVEEEKTISSQMARTYLLKRSIEMAIKNPIFGVGPGRFSDALEASGKKEGRHEASVGTHNTYTQLAAECGFPALIMFVAAIVITIRSSFRLYRATSKDPTQSLVSSLAFTCFALTVAYSIDVFFHHMAYYGNMPLLLGLWIAVDLATRRWKASQVTTAVAV